jgi:Cytochrome b(C-terminal)/b6/petD
MHGTETHDISGFLGFYYLALAVMNGVAALWMWQRLGKVRDAVIWLGVGMFFMFLSPSAMMGQALEMPQPVRGVLNAALTGNTGAIVYSVGTTIALIVLFIFRRFFVQPTVAWTMWNVAFFLMGLSMTDANFAAIVTKPDNVPIVALVFLLGFFTWLATYKAVQNDERLAQGLEPLEKLDNEKVLVWPDLVYTELICMIALTAVLLVWAIALQAPLEEPASSVKTPNPSKAPWYFLGLQEMLVYYDPWMAGVVLPSLVVFGLMAIPFLDFNKTGNGYYTINQRKFSYIIFQVGFLEMWVTLIILGTFLRGPNWNFFGPYEYWDPHKVLALNNIDLSQYFWALGLGRDPPIAPAGTTGLAQVPYILGREAPGIIALLVYFVGLPPLMAVTVFRSFFVRMGFFRYMLMSNLLLFMVALPLKMILRWSFNLKYIVAIPEFFLNF